MRKYESLWNYIKTKNLDEYKISFEEIKNIIGCEIDHSFLTYKKDLIKYGYEVKKISMKEKYILINKSH